MGTKVLVAEDEAVNIVIIEFLFQKLGFEVATATNGEEAVDMVQEEDYDLILMDIEMPIMNGLEATRAIRALPMGTNVPIIAMTAHSINEKLNEIQDAGMNDYLLKPLDQTKMKKVINKFL